MKLWIFSSVNRKNIEIGFENEMWAVAPHNLERQENAVTTRSFGMTPNSLGLLYCSGSFYMPFYTKSAPDTERIVKDIWPEPWRLPFDIEPMADPHRAGFPLKWAYDTWRLRRPLHGKTPIWIVAAFQPVEITRQQWRAIRSDFGIECSDPPAPALPAPRGIDGLA
jgi:hypothetical protein